MVLNQKQLRTLYDELVADIFTKPEELKALVDRQLAKREGFHQYSLRNIMLCDSQLYQQHGETTDIICSYLGFQKRGIQVLKGEKGLGILYPIFYEKENPKTGEMESKIRFGKSVCFDISQTNCTDKMRDSYVVTKRPDIEIEEIYNYFTAIIGRKYPIKLSSKITTLGYTDGKNIWLSKHLDTKDAIPVLFHEYTHAERHFSTNRAKMDSGFKEWEAEASSFMLSHALGVDNGESSAYLLNHNPNITQAESTKRAKGIINFVQKTLDQMKFQDFLYE